MKPKFQLLDLIVIFALSTISLFVVARNLPFNIGSFAFIWAPLALILILFSQPQSYFRTVNWWLYLYGVLIVGILPLVLWLYVREWTQSRIIFEFYYIVIFLVFYNHYSSRTTSDIWIKIITIVLWFHLVTLVTTNLGLFFDPLVIRQSASSGVFTPIQELIFNRFGVLGYSSAQAFVILIPPLIYFIKKEGIPKAKKNFFKIFLFLVILTQFRSQVFANLLVSILVTFLAFNKTRNNRISVLVIGLFLFVFVLVPNSFYAEAINSIAGLFDPKSEFYNKLNDLARYFEFQDFEADSGFSGRAVRYPQLWQYFLKSPLIGDSAFDTGSVYISAGHLYWMNRLTSWGVLAFGFFIFVLFKIQALIKSGFDSEFKYYYNLSIISFILLGLMKAIGGPEPWFMLLFFIPGLFRLKITNN